MSDENNALALDRLANWEEKGATLLFAFKAPGNEFTIRVAVKGVAEESVTFRWVLNASDTQGSFLTTNGHFVV
jgi:hypothetical protein